MPMKRVLALTNPCVSADTGTGLKLTNISIRRCASLVFRRYNIIKSTAVSGGSTTGPLGPGPQATELRGAPKFSTINCLRHNL